MSEIWRPIPSIPGAFASTKGRVQFPDTLNVPMPNGGVRNIRTIPRYGYDDKTAPKRAGSGCRKILRWRNRTYRVHQLVCEAFHGVKPFPEAIVLHLNEEPSDNRPKTWLGARASKTKTSQRLGKLSAPGLASAAQLLSTEER